MFKNVFYLNRIQIDMIFNKHTNLKKSKFEYICYMKNMSENAEWISLYMHSGSHIK